MGPLLSISLSNSRVKYSEKNVERERERESRPRDRPEKGRSWLFSISGKENGLGERRPCVMNTQGVEKGLEKDSKAVVQSDRVSGVTTHSSAKTIGQSKPV